MVDEKNRQEENKELIRKYFKAIDEAGKVGDADILDEFLAEDFIEHNPFPGLPPTRENWKIAFKMFADGAPGYHVIEELIAEGDMVVGRITAYGKHTGNLFGIPPTNKDFSMKGIAIWKIKDGKIKEHWNQTDELGVMIQLGVFKPPH